jgi:hypothetical protein
MKVSYTTTGNLELKELCKRVMKSNLSDDDKIEIITKLNQNNSNLVPSYPFTYIGGTLPNDPIYQAHKRGVVGTTGEQIDDSNKPHIYNCICREK